MSATTSEVTNAEAAKIELEEAAKKAGALPREEGEEEKLGDFYKKRIADEKEKAIDDEKTEEERLKTAGQKPNAGNGGENEKYRWE